MEEIKYIIVGMTICYLMGFLATYVSMRTELKESEAKCKKLMIKLRNIKRNEIESKKEGDKIVKIKQ